MIKSNTKKLVLTAMLIAMEIVLTRFLSIQLPEIRISFGFIPIVVIAILYGPLFAGLAAAIADFIGVTLFAPFAPFPGFVATAFAAGIVYGLLLYNKPKSWLRICLAAGIVVIIIQLGIETQWVSMTRGVPYVALLPIRLVRTAIMLPAQIICIRFLTQERFMKFFTRNA
ncbi:MAG: folate family ECF transporter S component [Defluviitaleaceae bacterium]|nr:folate family ECF transporter S component [Defluviitaleaceae bacterium]